MCRTSVSGSAGVFRAERQSSPAPLLQRSSRDDESNDGDTEREQCGDRSNGRSDCGDEGFGSGAHLWEPESSHRVADCGGQHTDQHVAADFPELLGSLAQLARLFWLGLRAVALGAQRLTLRRALL